MNKHHCLLYDLTKAFIWLGLSWTVTFCVVISSQWWLFHYTLLNVCIIFYNVLLFFFEYWIMKSLFKKKWHLSTFTFSIVLIFGKKKEKKACLHVWYYCLTIPYRSKRCWGHSNCILLKKKNCLETIC